MRTHSWLDYLLKSVTVHYGKWIGLRMTCRCHNGHLFHTQVLDDDPETNSLVLKADEEGCPECGVTEFEVVDWDTDYDLELQ